MADRTDKHQEQKQTQVMPPMDPAMLAAMYGSLAGAGSG